MCWLLPIVNALLPCVNAFVTVKCVKVTARHKRVGICNVLVTVRYKCVGKCRMKVFGNC